MADFNYTITNTNNENLSATVAYGTTSSLLTGELQATFNPASGISAVNIGTIGLSGDTTYFSAISTDSGEFPITLINTAGVSQIVTFGVTYDNTRLHADDETQNVLFTSYSSGASLSAGQVGTIQSAGTSYNPNYATLTALGDAGAPSGISGFTVTAGDREVAIAWVNSAESDVSGTLVQRSLTVVPSAYTEGTTVVNTTGSSYTDTSANDSNVTYYYAGFSYDNVGEYSSLSSSATGSASPTYHRWESQKEFLRKKLLGYI